MKNFLIGLLIGALFIGYFVSFTPVYAHIDDLVGLSKNEWYQTNYGKG